MSWSSCPTGAGVLAGQPLLAVSREHPDGRAQGEEERLAGVDTESEEYWEKVS